MFFLDISKCTPVNKQIYIFFKSKAWIQKLLFADVTDNATPVFANNRS